MNLGKKFLIVLLIVWLLGFIYIFLSNSLSSNSESNEELNRRFRDAERKLMLLELRNKNSEKMIKRLELQAKKTFSNSNRNDQSESVSKNSEALRRKIYADIKDVSYYFNSKSETITDKEFKNNFQDRINVLLAEAYKLSVEPPLGEWRQNEAKHLMAQVQSRFETIQNPRDCSTAKQVVCNLNKGCGFGCQMHHVMHCFIAAYFYNRTMVLESDNWRYNIKGYEAYFKQVGSCKTPNSQPKMWGKTALDENDDAIMMPIIDSLTYRPSFLPLAVPKELLDPLKRFHGDPFVWWSGQVLYYLMRFNDQMVQIVDAKRTNLGFQTPCVGVHVRRTDKVGLEASFHALSEYMVEVAKFFNLYELMHDLAPGSYTRTVYLASDEVEVLREAKNNYVDYNFVFDEQVAKSASMTNRYSPESAQGVILDIHFLSQCDFLVCTFSSQVCRLAYELMQTRFPDASWRFRSLDDVYYFGGQQAHNVRAILDHEPNANREEIELKVGDLIGLAGNHWTGYSKGRNLRTNRVGLFPSYKVVDVITSA